MKKQIYVASLRSDSKLELSNGPNQFLTTPVVITMYDILQAKLLLLLMQKNFF